MGKEHSKWCALPSIGVAGIVVCAWNPLYLKKRDEFSGNFSISVLSMDLVLGKEWLFTGVYGPASTSDRTDFWAELLRIKERWQGPWVVGGDYNVIRFAHEKSVVGKITKSMRNFGGRWLTFAIFGTAFFQMLNLHGVVVGIILS